MTSARLLRLILGACLALGPLRGQQPAFRAFGLRDGLPQSQVTALLEDRHGFLWVGTNTGGVARLGASGFQTFASPQGLKALFVRRLLEAPDGTIWVASQEGVSAIRGGTVTNHGLNTGMAPGPVSALTLDAEGRVLAASRSGLFRYDGRRFQTVALPSGWTSRPIRHALGIPGEGVWLADEQNRLALWKGDTLREAPLPAQPGERIRDLQADPQGRPWVVLAEALYRRSGDRWVPEPLAGLVKPWRLGGLSFDPRTHGLLLCLGSGGLLLRDPTGGVKVLDERAGLPRDRITVALRDRRGVLWVGSDGDGLAAQVLPELTNLDRPPPGVGKDLGAVTNILELGGGRFLLASSTGVFQVTDGQGITRHWNEASGLPANECWGMLPDLRGGVWIGTDRGLAHWSQGQVRPAGPSQLRSATILTLVRTGGRILAGTDRGLFELDEAGGFRGHFRLSEEVSDPTVSDVLPFGRRLLVATAAGIWERQGDHLEPVFPEAPFAGDTITALTLDSRQRLWVGTMKGVHLLSEGRWTSLGTRDGLADEGVNFILDVGHGRMAIGHTKGVTLLEGRQMHLLGRSQGIVSEETNHGGGFLDSRGRLWVGMIGGVSVLQNVAGFRNAPMPAPVVLEVRWPGGADRSASVQVPPRPDYLDIAFDTPSPMASAAIRYEALLQGVDGGWRPAGQGQPLQYRNLGAGAFTFRLRATMDGTTWTESAPVAIAIQPAWHELPALQALVVVGSILLLGGGLWWRVHLLAERSRALEETIDSRTHLLARQNRALGQAHDQIKRNLEDRLRLLDMVTHDLRSPLTTIMLSLDRLRDLAPGTEATLDVMELEAHRIEGLVRRLLDQSRLESMAQRLTLAEVPAAEVTEGFEQVLRLKAEAKGLAFELDLDPAAREVRIRADAATLHQVMLNLFENALKFTPEGGKVGLRSRVDRALGTWSLEVWDTGRGLEAGKIQEILQPFRQSARTDAAEGWGLGLSICLSILEAHGGELTVESQPGQGARFRFTLPLVEAPL